MSGPYDTEAQAATDITAGDPADLFLHLTDICEQAGVRLGRYDRRVLAWLARWEPATVQVVADLITRAHSAGREHRP